MNLSIYFPPQFSEQKVISILLLLAEAATTSSTAISMIYYFNRISCFPSPHAIDNTEQVTTAV
jgi:hypothetical protein